MPLVQLPLLQFQLTDDPILAVAQDRFAKADRQRLADVEDAETALGLASSWVAEPALDFPYPSGSGNPAM